MLSSSATTMHSVRSVPQRSQIRDHPVAARRADGHRSPAVFMIGRSITLWCTAPFARAPFAGGQFATAQLASLRASIAV